MVAVPPADPHPPDAPNAVDVAAFVMELAMVVVLIFSAIRVGSGRSFHVLLAVLLPVVMALVWAYWMAPTSARRLQDPWRFVGQVALFVLTGALAVATGLVVVGIVFAVIAIAVFALTRRSAEA